MNFKDPRLKEPNKDTSIADSYYKKKVSMLELELSELKAKNEFLRKQKEKLENEIKFLKGEL